MLSLVHTLISLPLGLYLEHPIIIFAAAMTLHLLADTMLHWNIYPYKFSRYPYGLVALDVLGGVAAAWLVLGDQFFTLPLLTAIAGGNFPDILHGLWDTAGRRAQRTYLAWARPIFDWHENLQLETDRVLHGLVSQAAAVVIALSLVIAA